MCDHNKALYKSTFTLPYLTFTTWKSVIIRHYVCWLTMQQTGVWWFSIACSSNGTVRVHIPLRYRLIWVFLVVELCCCADQNHQGQLIMQKIHLRSHLLQSVVCFLILCSFYIALSFLLFWAYCLTRHTCHGFVYVDDLIVCVP